MNRLSKDTNKAIIVKQECLLHAELEILYLKDSSNNEHKSITYSTTDHSKDVVVFNVSGKMMAAKYFTTTLTKIMRPKSPHLTSKGKQPHRAIESSQQRET